MRKATSGRREARAPIASPTPAAAITITMFALSTLDGRSMHPCSYCEVSEVEVDLDRWTFYFHAESKPLGDRIKRPKQNVSKSDRTISTLSRGSDSMRTLCYFPVCCTSIHLHLSKRGS